MTDSLFTGLGSRYTLGLIIMILVSIYGLFLLYASFNKHPVSIHNITLSLGFQRILGLLLQVPCLFYVWIGFYAGILVN